MRSEVEQQIRILEEGLDDLYFRAARLAQRLGRLKQTANLIRNVPGTIDTCNATYSGNVHGCGAGNVAGATVDIVEPGSGAVLDTQTTDASGNYSGTVAIALAGEDLNVRITASGYSVSTTLFHFDCSSPNSIGTITLTVALGACCADFTGLLRNCDNSGNSGATVVAKIAGVTVYTGTTDGSGNISGSCELVTGAATSVDFTITATSSRFAVYTHTYTLVCGSNVLGNINLSAATGYVCCSVCALPIKTVLTLTDPIIGVVTLTWNGSVWAGTIGYTAGCSTGTDCTGAPRSCPPATVAVTYAFNCASLAALGTMNVTYLARPATGCPAGGAPLITGSQLPTRTTLACPPSFVATFVFSNPCPAVTTFTSVLWCTVPVTITVTE